MNKKSFAIIFDTEKNQWKYEEDLRGKEVWLVFTGEKDHAKAMHEAWCRKQIDVTVKNLESWVPYFKTLPDFAKVVLVDMTYNLNTKIKDFKKMLAALEKG